jgi:hypothetical protein
MHSMRRHLRNHGVREWAADFLNALSAANPTASPMSARTDRPEGSIA